MTTPPEPQPAPPFPTTPYVILGLGNPGEKYAKSRHNVGAQAVALLARRCHIPIEKVWGEARIGEGTIEGLPVVLARTRTFMNLSGNPARGLLRRTGSPPSQLLVLCDDLDLDLGKLRMRAKGSSGGHNGLRSVIAGLGTDEFPRLRLGIGRPYGWEERARRDRDLFEEDMLRWVLGNFSPDEEKIAQEMRERAADAVVAFLTEGALAAMNRFN